MIHSTAGSTSWKKPLLPLRVALTTLKDVILVGHKKFNFVYQTKNKINGKTYIGVHCTNVLNDGYIGCGIRSQNSTNYYNTAFSNAVKKYGYENFDVEILSFFDSAEEAYEEESFLVCDSWVNSKNNYNTSVGGRHPKMSDDGKKRVSERMKVYNPMKNPDVASKVGAIASARNKGQKRTPEQIENIKKIRKDYCSKVVLDTLTNTKYSSMRKCSESIGKSRTFISDRIGARFKFM